MCVPAVKCDRSGNADMALRKRQNWMFPPIRVYALIPVSCGEVVDSHLPFPLHNQHL